MGELTENALADIIAVPFVGRSAEVFESILHHKGSVAASMIGGVWALPPQAA